MLSRLVGIRYISARKLRRLERKIEEETTRFPPPIPPNEECIKQWRDGLSPKFCGGIHGEYKNPDFKSLMSKIFDLVYKDIGIRLPKQKAMNPEYKLYKLDEIDQV